jgi:hypothetical protein
MCGCRRAYMRAETLCVCAGRYRRKRAGNCGAIFKIERTGLSFWGVDMSGQKMFVLRSTKRGWSSSSGTGDEG